MKERVLDFKVSHPQLEQEPGRFKGGVKRYHLHKNEDSAALVVGGSIISRPLDHPRQSAFNNISSPSIGYHQSARKANYSLSPEYNPLELRRIRSPAKYSFDIQPPSNYLELIRHPAFRQPHYTKQSPKIQRSNPIIGYSELPSGQNSSNSLSFKANGNKILSSANKLNLYFNT